MIKKNNKAVFHCTIKNIYNTDDATGNMNTDCDIDSIKELSFF